MEKCRFLQWTTGKVGKLAMRAILDNPRLELADVLYQRTPAGFDTMGRS